MNLVCKPERGSLPRNTLTSPLCIVMSRHPAWVKRSICQYYVSKLSRRCANRTEARRIIDHVCDEAVCGQDTSKGEDGMLGMRDESSTSEFRGYIQDPRNTPINVATILSINIRGHSSPMRLGQILSELHTRSPRSQRSESSCD